MSQASANRRSAYLTALIQEIERKLQRALNSPSQRIDLIQQLFNDIALEIDDRARDIIGSRSEDEIAKEDDRMDNCLCFYEVLAEHYVGAPEDWKCVLDLIVQLWGQSFVSHIFAHLFHNYLKFLLKILKPCCIMDLHLFKVLQMFFVNSSWLGKHEIQECINISRHTVLES